MKDIALAPFSVEAATNNKDGKFSRNNDSIGSMPDFCSRQIRSDVPGQESRVRSTRIQTEAVYNLLWLLFRNVSGNG